MRGRWFAGGGTFCEKSFCVILGGVFHVMWLRFVGGTVLQCFSFLWDASLCVKPRLEQCVRACTLGFSAPPSTMRCNAQH
jgi:hypothetical protein